VPQSAQNENRGRQPPLTHHQPKTLKTVTFRRRQRVKIGREKGVAFGCDLTGSAFRDGHGRAGSRRRRRASPSATGLASTGGESQGSRSRRAGCNLGPIAACPRKVRSRLSATRARWATNTAYRTGAGHLQQGAHQPSEVFRDAAKLRPCSPASRIDTIAVSDVAALDLLQLSNHRLTVEQQAHFFI
jgi:hypothetical protein